MDRKTNLYTRCIDCHFQRFETIGKEELSCLLQSLI